MSGPTRREPEGPPPKKIVQVHSQAEDPVNKNPLHNEGSLKSHSIWEGTHIPETWESTKSNMNPSYYSESRPTQSRGFAEQKLERPIAPPIRKDHSYPPPYSLHGEPAGQPSELNAAKIQMSAGFAAREPSGPPPELKQRSYREPQRREPRRPHSKPSTSTNRNPFVSSSVREPLGRPPVLSSERPIEALSATISVAADSGEIFRFGVGSTSSTSTSAASAPSNLGRTRLDGHVETQSNEPVGDLSTAASKKRGERDFQQVSSRNEAEQEAETLSDDKGSVGEEEQEDDEEAEEFKFEPASFASTVVTDPHKLSQRQKQIDKGKNTTGYQNYTATVPRHARQRFNKIHPVTPDMKDATLSKRQFDGQVKAWRRQLHLWDTLPGQKPIEAKPYILHEQRKENKRMKVMAAKESRMDTEKDALVNAEGVAPSHAESGKESSLFDEFTV